MHNLAIYDRDLAVERAGGSPDLATDLFGMLLQELPAYRSDLVSALAQNDLPTLQYHAHKLHGSATYTGVSALRHAVAGLEQDVKKGLTDHLQERVDAVLQEIERVLRFAEAGMTN
jgi:two-component system sensor histidine kinase BarA